MSNVLEEINVTLKTKLDEKGTEDLQKKLKSYNLGKEFNYAVVVLKLIIANGESKTKDSLVVKLVPKVQYITPFVSKELAENYMKELSILDKLMMFLEIGEDGRVVLKENEINNKEKEASNLSMCNVLNIIANNWNSISKENKKESTNKLAGDKNN